MNFKKLTEQIHKDAVDKGWWPEEGRNFGECVALIHAELSELLEAYRDGILHEQCDKPVELTCFEEEVADVFIRLADLCEAHEVDLHKSILLKMEYNRTRKYRHGGKKA